MPVRKKKQTKFQPQRLARWFLLSAAVVIVSAWSVTTFYAIQKYSAVLSFGPIRALVFSPKYLSINEDEEVRFAFENPSAIPVSVTFGLENNSTLPGFLGLQESSTIYSGTVQSRQQINRQAKVFFHADLTRLGETFNQVPQLSLWGSIDNSPAEKKNLEIYFASIPSARSLSNYLGTVLLGLVGLLFREAWDQVKKSGVKKR